MFNFREKPKISNRLFRPNCFSPSRSRSDTPFFSFLPNNFFSNPPRKKLVKRVWVFRSLVFRRRVALGRRVGATAFVSVVTGFDGGSMTSRYGRPKTSTSWHRPRNPVCDVAKRCKPKFERDQIVNFFDNFRKTAALLCLVCECVSVSLG